MAYLIINYDQPSNMYGIISYIKHGWHSAKTSQHMITLPNDQYHPFGHALHSFISIRLEEVKSSLESLKLALHGPRIVTTSDGMVEVFQMQPAHAHELEERWPCASQPRAQTIPFGTIVVNKNTNEALKVAVFDSRHPEYENYGLIPIHSDGDPNTAIYEFWPLPNVNWISLGMNSPQVLDMLSLNGDTLLYTLKDEHLHLLQSSQPASPTTDNPPSSPSSSSSSSNSSLGDFDPNMEGLPPFEEGGPDLQQNVPRSAQHIPHHPAYSIPDTTGQYTLVSCPCVCHTGPAAP